jgi:hypothetical protein
MLGAAQPEIVCTIKLVYQSAEILFVDFGFWWGLLEFGLSWNMGWPKFNWKVKVVCTDGM